LVGAQRQVAFAVALSHSPELLILDEPTSGVGPLGGARLWEQIRGAVGRAAGALVTTHNMEEAEQCDRLVVMAAGKVVATGTTAGIIGDRGDCRKAGSRMSKPPTCTNQAQERGRTSRADGTCGPKARRA